LLEVAAAVTLPPDVLAQLDARTDGWAVGLHMAALGLRGHADPAAFVASFSGSHRFVLDYLLEEVLARMTAPARARLLAVSIVEQLDGDLVDAIAGTDDGAAWLEQLDSSNLFVIALDDRRARFRFHHLFRTLLQHELVASTTAEQRQHLHRRAAAVLEARGHVEEALELWRSAQAWSEVERLVLDRSLQSLIRSDLRHIGRDFERIPEAVLEERPALAVRHYWVAMNEVTPQVVQERLYARAQRALARCSQPDAAAELALCEAATRRHRDLATAC